MPQPGSRGPAAAAPEMNLNRVIVKAFKVHELESITDIGVTVPRDPRLGLGARKISAAKGVVQSGILRVCLATAFLGLQVSPGPSFTVATVGPWHRDCWQGRSFPSPPGPRRPPGRRGFSENLCF